MRKVMTKTELKRQQTKEVIELLQNKFGATNFDNDQGSYFTFNIGDFTGHLERRDFSVLIHEAMRMGPGFTQEEYDIRDAAEVLENGLNKEIENYLNK
jgi:hypothetical protein